MKTLTLTISAALSLPLALLAQSTSGSSGTGTTEPGPSAAEASGFGNTGRSPSVTGSNEAVRRGNGAASSQSGTSGTAAAATLHGSTLTADALFRKLDVNGDGQLSRHEFTKLQSILGGTGGGGKE